MVLPIKKNDGDKWKTALALQSVFYHPKSKLVLFRLVFPQSNRIPIVQLCWSKINIGLEKYPCYFP